MNDNQTLEEDIMASFVFFLGFKRILGREENSQKKATPKIGRKQSKEKNSKNWKKFHVDFFFFFLGNNFM